MEFVGQDQLGELVDELISAHPTPGVSIYIPTRPGGAGARKDPIYLKNMLREAEAQLDRRCRELLIPLRGLVEHRELWRRTAGGLALFCSPELRRALLWPRPFSPTCVVGGHFHARPLIARLRDTRPFFALCVSPKATRLLRCTRFSARRIEHPLLPASLDAALPFDEPERPHHHHTYAAGGGRGAGFHGQAALREPQDRDRRYLQVIREALGVLLAQEQAPLVIAMTEPLAALFLEVNRYPHVIEDPVTTSPDHLRDDELRDRAWERVEPLLQEQEQRATARLMDLLGTERSAAGVEAVVPLAIQGRVDTLFIAADATCFGRIDEDDQSVTLDEDDGAGPGRRELLDLAAQSTLLNHGRVHELPGATLPTGGQVAATLRY